MERLAEKTNYFRYQKEEQQNPFIGFMSFQHFKDEALYSDMVVLPERNMTETEDYECYPIPDHVGQNGRAEGYYPDTSVCYIRFLWKEFEPVRGEYNYGFVEDIITKAKNKGQTLILRLLPHSTRESDDVPGWLKEMIPCPERPAGKRVKASPTAPEFLGCFTQAVRKLGERFDKEPTLEAIDISLPGAWGEGTNLHLYSQESLTELFETYTSVFQNTRLLGQIIKPDLINKANAMGCRVGLRGDGFGDPHHIYDRYPEAIEKLNNLWQTAPISFESYWWLGEWKRKGWDLDEIISTTLQWHISSFNAKSLPIPWEWKDKIDYWVSKMGYHFCIDYFKFPETAQPSDCLELKLAVENLGVAPIYKKIPLMVRMRNHANTFVFDSGIDITKWLPGKAAERFFITVPAEAENGDYILEIGIQDENIPAVYFCSDAKRDGAFYQVGELRIEALHGNQS